MVTTTNTKMNGNWWRVLEQPRVPHEELDSFAREVWHLAFHGIPWPSGWGVRWAACRDALGMCDDGAKLILIDEARNLDRRPHKIVETLVHEMAHSQHPGEVHGSRWRDTCDRATAFVLSELELEREPTTASELPDVVPEPWIDEWETRSR